MRAVAFVVWCAFWWSLPALCMSGRLGALSFNFIGLGVTVAFGATLAGALYLAGYR